MKQQCPDIEDVFEFAENPMQESNAEIAAHILTCPACQENFRIALEIIDMPSTPATAEENDDAEKIVARMLNAHKLQTKLKDTIKALCSQLEKAAFVLVDPQNLPWFQEDRKGLSFAAKQSPDNRPTLPTADFVIRFNSYQSEESPYFWRMELSIPRLLHAETVMPIRITGTGGRNIDRAKLVYLGVELPVSDGKAGLTAQNFKDSLKGHGIAVIFRDGTIAPGEISFQL